MVPAETDSERVTELAAGYAGLAAVDKFAEVVIAVFSLISILELIGFILYCLL